MNRINGENIVPHVNSELPALVALLKKLPYCDVNSMPAICSSIADFLIHNVALVAGGQMYQIKEVEFYVNNGNHPDPYVHSVQYSKTIRQYEFGEWYFHRFKTLESYTHNRRGLDLSIGNKDLGTSGGILIRGIKPMCSADSVYGPSKVVATIMQALVQTESNISMHDLAQKIQGFPFDSRSPLRLVAYEQQKHQLLCNERYGLSPKTTDTNAHYQKALYRFFDREHFAKMPGREGVFRQLVDRGVFETTQANNIIGYKLTM